MEHFLATILKFGGNFAPEDREFCNGQPIYISQDQALYSLMGTTYGGNGTTTFTLPDMHGRMPMHFSQRPGLANPTPGGKGGAGTVTLSLTQIPRHIHSAIGLASGKCLWQW